MGQDNAAIDARSAPLLAYRHFAMDHFYRVAREPKYMLTDEGPVGEIVPTSSPFRLVVDGAYRLPSKDWKLDRMGLVPALRERRRGHVRKASRKPVIERQK